MARTCIPILWRIKAAFRLRECKGYEQLCSWTDSTTLNIKSKYENGSWKVKKTLIRYRAFSEKLTQYLSKRSISINSRTSIHLSSSGMCTASMEIGSSQSILHPLISDNFKAWTCSDWLGTRAHWCGLRHWTFNLGGNWKKKN